MPQDLIAGRMKRARRGIPYGHGLGHTSVSSHLSVLESVVLLHSVLALVRRPVDGGTDHTEQVRQFSGGVLTGFQ